ncbi:hypothetical protein CR152_00850 [Massilia violaceinigra]|uniref:Peptidoglycan-binding protein n=1 Tax=Massilia violaceinigra TaxID=2045208 RepID=A0A2D2DDZ7_9BURK|nr:hypothetical protein [Massilia violaceinigra]ATQ73215.1 hypothetical protein CR152_00850 [Massilia violaceinigra]
MTPGPNPAVLIALTVMALAGCASKPPPGSIKSPNSQLEHCPRSLGTLTLVEPERQPGRNRSGSDADLPAPMPLLRLMVKSSNCFTLAQHTPSLSERTLTTSGYTATPSLSFGDDAAAGRIGSLHELALHPSTLLILTDNRSGTELAAAQGSASYWRFGAAGGFFNGGFAGAGGYTRTPQGKVLTAALVDSYNQMVRSLRNHTVRAEGGRLADAGGLRLSRAAPSALPRSQ